MKCPKCQHENPEDARFCMRCGHNLTLPSEPASKELSLDEKLKKAKRYFPKDLIEKILSERDKIEGERKQVTVMFCDMEGFTSLTERLGAEEAYSIMDEVYELLIHKVHDYEGTVNEMTGDGIMALFGAPVALEDAPQWAIRSAFAIHQEMSTFSDEKRQQREDIPPLKMRIGIHTGPVVVGTLGYNLRVEFKAVGDTVNLASRMESLAEPGTTYVTEDTFRLTEGLFQFEALGEKKVKGKKKPVPVHKLVSVKKDVFRPRLGSERIIYSEMVGRDSELNKVELQATKAVNGEGSVVNIIGEAGIGKSRLVAELKNRDVIKKVVILEGRAISIGRNLSFHPIISLLKHWARIREDDDEAAAFGKLENALSKVCPEDLIEILPFIAILMGMKLTGRYAEIIEGIEGEALQKNILKAMRDILTRATELTPLVIVMEDLHWADTSSIELLESLFRLSENRRIVFVNVFRPDHRDTGDRIVETLKERLSTYYLEITLEPLDKQDTETLINNMLNVKGLYRGVKDKIIQRAGGNPFFVEEVVRSFIDEGAVVKKNEGFEITDKIDSVSIPLTINDVLMARIDRLEEKTRNLVKVASVIGRNFFHRILSKVNAATGDIDTRLDYLKTIQLIRERRRMGEIEYLFKHALAQEAAYESILMKKRKGIHLKVAQSIEMVFKERLHEFYGMLAFHYSKGEDEEKTEEYLIKAGEEALRSSASSEALHYYKEALNLYLKKYGATADPEKIAMLEKNIAIAYYNRGQAAETVEYFNKVLKYHGVQEGNLTASGILKLFLRIIYFAQGIYMPFFRWKKTPSNKDNEINRLVIMRNQFLSTVSAKKFFIEMINYSKRLILLDISKLEQGDLIFCGYAGLFSYGGISFKISRKILELVKDKVNKNDAYSLLVHEMQLVIHGYLSGECEFIKEYDIELLNQNMKNVSVIQVAYISFHCKYKIDLGYYIDAKSLIEKLDEIGKVYDHELSFVTKYYINTYSLIKWRELQEAMIELNEGINLISKTLFDRYLFAMYSMKADLQIMMMDIQSAESSLQHANEIKLELSLPPDLLRYFLRSCFLLNLYKLEQSINTCEASEMEENKSTTLKAGKKAVKNAYKVAFEQIEIFKLMGVYCWIIGKQRKALKWWNRSIQEGERLGALPELSRSYMEVGKRLLEPKCKYSELNGISAKEYLEKARKLFTSMDLQWDLDELDKIVGSH